MPTYSLRRLGLVVVVVALVSVCVGQTAVAQSVQWCRSANAWISVNDLCLLECTPAGLCVIPASLTSGMGAFFLYTNFGFWQWAFGIGIAIAVLNATIGGLQMTLSNGEQAAFQAGRDRILWSILRLLLLLLSGTILSFINPAGFAVV